MGKVSLHPAIVVGLLRLRAVRHDVKELVPIGLRQAGVAQFLRERLDGSLWREARARTPVIDHGQQFARVDDTIGVDVRDAVVRAPIVDDVEKIADIHPPIGDAHLAPDNIAGTSVRRYQHKGALALVGQDPAANPESETPLANARAIEPATPGSSTSVGPPSALRNAR